MAARLTEWKGQRVSIAAMERVTNEIPDAQLLLAGAALFGEDDYVRSLQEEIEARGLSENVHLVGHVADPTSFYRGVDIALHTSVMPEPFGLSIVDAMVAGRPVDAAAGGAVHEILGGQSGGVVVEPSDPTALARGILDLAATGPAGLQLRGDLARRRARVYDIRRSALLTARFFHGCSPPIQDG
jgi:glycosyltransferase involved in cell wall biosynthesis